MLRPMARWQRLAKIAALTALVLVDPARMASGEAADADGAKREAQALSKLAAELASIRGGVQADLRVVAAGPTEIGARLDAMAAQAAQDRAAARRARAVARFGLPVSVLDSAEAAPAYYDDGAERVYFGGGGDEPAVVREVARAVLDHHVGRAAFLAGAPSRDAAIARWALWEGDAAAIALEREMAGGAPLAWGDALTEAMLRGADAAEAAAHETAYRAGLAFIAHHRRHHPWSRIDAMYQRPPRSTSQLLHPALYARDERPRVIEASGVGVDRFYRLVYDDVQGELELRNWLIEHGVVDARAAGAARGWLGDRLAIYAPVSRLGGAWPDLGVLKTRWRTGADAAEFEEAAARALASLAGGSRVDYTEGIAYRSPRGDLYFVERRGEAVIIVVGALTTWRDDIRRAVWAWGS